MMPMPNALSSVAGASCSTSSEGDGEEEDEEEISEQSYEDKLYETLYVPNGHNYSW